MVAGCESSGPPVRAPAPPSAPQSAPSAETAVRSNGASASPRSPVESLEPAVVLAPTPTTADEVLLRVGGRDLTKADLGDFVLRFQPERAAEAMDQLVEEAVVDVEARRESVVVPQKLLAERTDAYVDERRRSVRVQFGATADFEAFLASRLGRDLAGFRADAERLVRTTLLRERLVRLDQFREDGVEVRVLVLPSQEAARDAAKAVRDGADMTLVAEGAGARRPASPPPFARGEIPEKDLEARLFECAAGDVLDPAPFDGDGGVYWQVFKVTRAWKADAAPWTTVGPRVEESLRTTPVAPEEALRWRRRAFARLGLLEGEPAKGSVRTSAGQ